MKGRLSITEVAKSLGVTPRTIMRWEKSEKIKKSKRDWRGWRFYTSEDVDQIRAFYESSYEYDELERSIVATAKEAFIVLLAAGGVLAFALCSSSFAEPASISNTPGVKETASTVDIVLEDLPARGAVNTSAAVDTTGMMDPIKYTLGPNDVIAIDVKRHPEFGGEYTINSEGKIEYKYIGDVILAGLTKAEATERVTEILDEYLIEPDINIQIVAYLSKVVYVVGDVQRPGKFFMKGDTITVRDILFQSGLPTMSAAMRRCRIITPDEKGKDNYVNCNIFSLLYEGNLDQNLTMKPGDVLYVPCTVLAKALRVISPITDITSQTTGTAIGAASNAAVLF